MSVNLAINSSFGTETVPGGNVFPLGTTLTLPADGSALPTITALDAAATASTLNTTTDTTMAPAVSGDLNLLMVENGTNVLAPAGYGVIADLSTTAPTISTAGTLGSTVLGGSSGMTVWDNSANETVYTGGGDNVIGMSSTVMESLDVVLAGGNEVVAVGVGDATVTGGGSSNIVWGSGTSTQSNLTVDMVRGSTSVMAGVGSNTIDLGGTNDVIFGGYGINNDTVSGANDIYVAGSGVSTVSAGASDVIFAGSNTMDATIGGTGAIFVGGTGNDTINASTGATGWGGSGTMNFISSGNTTIVGASGATTAIQNSGTGDYFNNGAGVMTVSGGSGPATITESWAGNGGMLLNAGTNGGDTINMTEGTTTVVAGSTNNTINFYGNASGNVWLTQSETVDLAGSGYVAVSDTTAALPGHNLINAQGDTGTANITFGTVGDTIFGGYGTNIYTPYILPQSPGGFGTISFGTGTNELVLNPQNTSSSATKLQIFNFNPNRDLIDFNGFGSTTLAQEAASMAEQNLLLPGGQHMPMTYFLAGSMDVQLYAGSAPSSQMPVSNIVASHFIST